MLLSIYLLFNPGFVGDNQQVLATQKALIETIQVHNPDAHIQIQSVVLEEQDPGTPNKLKEAISASEKNIVILCGSHGYNFLDNPVVAEAISQKTRVVWTGHQDPGLITKEKLIDRVALPIHIIEGKPELTHVFKDRLIAMEMVPNMLGNLNLDTELKKWNDKYSAEAIPKSESGYIGVFLGGDAPKEDGTYLYWGEKEAYDYGRSFGAYALQQKKFLLVTNGPRTGKFYPGSANPKKPVIRQCDETGQFLGLDKLLAEQHQISDPTLPYCAHAEKFPSPMDPVSSAFLRGLLDAGLDLESFKFFDFKYAPHGSKGVPSKSAYNAMVAALQQNPENSIAFYSGESISYAEIGYFVPHTYAFPISPMNDGHKRAVERFSHTLHLVGTIEFVDRAIILDPIDMDKKKGTLSNGSNQDANRFAQKITDGMTLSVNDSQDATNKVGFVKFVRSN